MILINNRLGGWSGGGGSGSGWGAGCDGGGQPGLRGLICTSFGFNLHIFISFTDLMNAFINLLYFLLIFINFMCLFTLILPLILLKKSFISSSLFYTSFSLIIFSYFYFNSTFSLRYFPSKISFAFNC